MNEIICNKIQTSISLWKEDLETVIENIKRLCSSETNSYHWLIFDGLKSITSMNPYENLEWGKTRLETKIKCLIDNRQKLCEHGGLHQMIEIRGKYISGKVYNTMKETSIKNWESKSVLVINSSEEIPKFNNHDISESNMRCDICIKELCHYMSKTLSYWINYIFLWGPETNLT